jgi:pyrroline-5-carboxylate reductase
METIGIIGLGSMGRMLAEGWLERGAAAAEHLAVANRTREKALEFGRAHPGVTVAADVRAAAAAGTVFLCVPPDQVRAVLEEIRPVLSADQHLVSIAAYVTLADLAAVVGVPTSKAMPSFAAEAGDGVALVCHGAGVDDARARRLERLLGSLGEIRTIREDQFEVYSDITSCGPGIFAAVCERYVAAAGRHGDIDPEAAAAMLMRTLRGLANLHLQGGRGFADIIARVARRGGITETAIAALDAAVPDAFDAMFALTLAKHEARKRELGPAFRA